MEIHSIRSIYEVYDAIMDSKKYLVGFQCFTDLLFMVRNQYCKTDSLDKFRSYVKMHFGGLIDCKVCPLLDAFIL